MIFRHDIPFEPAIANLPPRVAERWGFRTGPRGTHSSRTIMLDELTQLLDAVPPDSPRHQYAEAIVDGNCLGKLTVATRKASSQRLRELYGLDARVILFRALRHLWANEAARPTLALLLALARDPLLRATARAVLATPIGQEFSRQSMKDDVAAIVEDRLSPATLDTAVRNAAASWTQSGHLTGRRPQDPAARASNTSRCGLCSADRFCGRLAAALALQARLAAISKGAAPFDIFVRWKPIHQQAVGWDPDLNDGIRLNIRPFRPKTSPEAAAAPEYCA